MEIKANNQSGVILKEHVVEVAQMELVLKEQLNGCEQRYRAQSYNIPHSDQQWMIATLSP
jgi:hypothetical protein